MYTVREGEALMMTDAELQAIQDRCDRALPGPWSYYRRDLYGLKLRRIHTRFHEYEHVVVVCGDGDGDLYDGLSQNDGLFIAAARQDVPRLLDEVARLRALLAAVTCTGPDDGQPCVRNS
jgi:hypothetical protein